MKATKFIKELQELVDKYGDLELVYAKDDEGNGFSKLSFGPTPGIYHDRDHEFSEIDETEEDTGANAICVN